MVAGGYESVSNHPSLNFPGYLFPSRHHCWENCMLHLGEPPYTLWMNWHLISIWPAWSALKHEASGLSRSWSIPWRIQGCSCTLSCHECCVHQIRDGPPYYTWDFRFWNMGAFSPAYDSDHAGPCGMGETCNNKMWTRHSAQPNHHASHDRVLASGIGKSLLFSTPPSSQFWIYKLLSRWQPYSKAYPRF